MAIAGKVVGTLVKTTIGLFGTGLVPEAPDKRDYQFSTIVRQMPIDVPSAVDLRPMLPEVKNQRSISSCVSHAVSACLEYYARFSRGIKYKLGPQFVHDLRNRAPPDQNQDNGMGLRAASKLAFKYGMPPETIYPYVERFEKVTPCERAARAAKNFVISSYWWINTVAEAKIALTHIGPIALSMPTYTAVARVDDVRPTNEFWKGAESERSKTGHCACIVGYNGNGFIIRNSWSTNWNGDGHIIMPFRDFTKLYDPQTADPSLSGFGAVVFMDGSVGLPDPMANVGPQPSPCGPGDAPGTFASSDYVWNLYEDAAWKKKSTELQTPYVKPTKRVLKDTRAIAFTPYRTLNVGSTWNSTYLTSTCAMECEKDNNGGGDCGIVTAHNPRWGKSTCALGSFGAAKGTSLRPDKRWTTVFMDRDTSKASPPPGPVTRTLDATEARSFAPYKTTNHNSKWNMDALAIECAKKCVNETKGGGDCAMVAVANPKKGNSTCSYASAASIRDVETQASDQHTAVFVDS